MEATGHGRWFERLLAELRRVSIASTRTLFLNRKASQPIGTGAPRWRLFDLGRVEAESGQSRGAPRKQRYRTLSPAESP
jgi:hypothetical protein